jgi:hypothetical protein
MSIALTCDCGARFDLDEDLAGQKVPCPECLQPLEVPAAATTAAAASTPTSGVRRTSLLSLASVVLALLGAFTIVGTVAAVVLGLAALVQIKRHPRLGGTFLAVAGIVSGLVFTALTVVLLSRSDLVGVDGWIRQRTLAGALAVDTTGALEVLSRDGNVVLRRPSEKWGRLLNDRGDDPAVGDLQQKRELLLVNVWRHAFIDVGRAGQQATLTDVGRELAKELQQQRTGLLGEDEDGPTTTPGPAATPVRDAEGNFGRDFEKDEPGHVEGWEAREWIYDVFRGGQKWRFLIRAYKKLPGDPRDPIYVIRAYAPMRRFEAIEEELRAALNTVSLPK